MNGSFIRAKDGYWLVIQNTSRVSLFCFCSHELFPTFSSFSRQTDIHGCSWSIGIALGISEHWQLQVHCYFLSTEGPRMTTFVRGTKAVVYWCLLMSTAKLAEGLFDGTRRSGTVSCRDWSFQRAEALQTTVTPWLEHSDRMLKGCSDSVKMCQTRLPSWQHRWLLYLTKKCFAIP